MKLAIFCNNFRGLEIIKFLKKKFEIELVIIAKKNLNKSILSYIKKNFIYRIVSDVNNLKVFNLIKNKNIDLNIVVGFPYIFKKRIIESSKYGTMNLHGGKLPGYRGGSPLNWQIINNEKKIGLSIIKMTEKIDQGPLVEKISFDLKKNDNIENVKKKSYKFFKKILLRSIDNFIEKKFIKIDYKKGRYFYQRNANDSKIDFKRMTNLQVYNLVRATTKPYYSFYILEKKKIVVKKVNLSKINIVGKFGTIVKRNNFLFIKCKKGAIKVLK